MFHNIRLLLDRCPDMLMQLIGASVRCQRSSYREEVAHWDLVAHRERGRERPLDPEPDLRHFCEVILAKLLNENANRRAKFKDLAKIQQLLQHLQMASLVPQVQGKVTKAVRTEAIKQ